MLHSFLDKISSAIGNLLASIVLGAIPTVWAWLTGKDWQTIIIIAIFAFTVLMVNITCFIVLKSKYMPLTKRMDFDYGYGLALIALTLGYDEINNRFQLGLNLYNATVMPIKYHLEEISIVVGDRTIRNPTFENRGGIISRGTTIIFYYPSFEKAAITSSNDLVEARIQFTILYGHPDTEYTRKTKKDLNVTLRLDSKPAAIYTISNESDVTDNSFLINCFFVFLSYTEQVVYPI